MNNQTSSVTLDFVDAEGGMGVHVGGLSLSEEPSPETASLLKEKLATHGLLIFEPQDLKEEEQLRFTRAFGETIGHPVPGVGGGDANMESDKEVFYLINDPAKKSELEKKGRADGALGWHTDLEYMPEPQVYSLLYGVEIPPEGGDTEWCNLCDAYDALEESMKQKIASLLAVRWYTRSIPQVSHPIVRRHPISGRKGLYVSPALCKYIEDMDEEEGKALIAELSQHATQSRFCYVHRWSQRELLMWDNRLTLHRRHGFDVSHRRVVRRTQTKGEPVFT